MRLAAPNARHRVQLWGALATGAIALIPVLDAVCISAEGPAHIDDAFISYRYAANLVAGDGLVWNPGERVEGITNPLWTLLVAVGLALGASATTLGTALGVIGGAASLVLTVAFAATLLPRDARWLAPLAAVPLASSAALVFWSTAGLETAFHAALVCGAMLAAARGSRPVMVVLLIGVVWSRMDGVLLAVVLLGFDLAPRWRSPRAWLPGATFAACMIAALSMRFAYYGEWLPNTYWAKVGGTPIAFGLHYLDQFLSDGPALLLPAAAVAVFARPLARPAMIFGLLHTAYVIRVGGDAFAFHRFMLVVLAPLCALAVAGLAAAHQKRPWLGWLLAPTLPASAAVQVFGTVPIAWVIAVGPAWIVWGAHVCRPLPGRLLAGAASVAALVGLAASLVAVGGTTGLLAARTEAPRNVAMEKVWRSSASTVKLQKRRSMVLRREKRSTLVAAGAIGALGFYSQLPILDLLGLTDAHIARTPIGKRESGFPMAGHARSDADYVFSRRPEVIVIPQPGDGPVWMFALKDLWAHPELERSYEWDDVLKAYRRRRDADEG